MRNADSRSSSPETLVPSVQIVTQGDAQSSKDYLDTSSKNPIQMVSDKFENLSAHELEKS